MTVIFTLILIKLPRHLLLETVIHCVVAILVLIRHEEVAGGSPVLISYFHANNENLVELGGTHLKI